VASNDSYCAGRSLGRAYVLDIASSRVLDLRALAKGVRIVKQFLTDVFQQWLTEDRWGLATAFLAGMLSVVVVVLVVAGLVRILS
jgi:glutathione S-transferase